jgi:hypothetical protein
MQITGFSMAIYPIATKIYGIRYKTALLFIFIVTLNLII